MTPAATMPEVLQLTPADARRRPWRNGRGVTEELALWPPGAEVERGDFDWRLARAQVEEPGPLSPFPGCERVLVVASGAGLELEHGEHAPRARLRPLEPYRFLGDWPTTAAPLGGPVVDLDVLVRHGAGSAEVEALRLGARRAREPVGPGHAFAHVLSGRVDARVTGEERTFELAVGGSLWARDLRGGEELDLRGATEGTRVLLVRLAPPTA